MKPQRSTPLSSIVLAALVLGCNTPIGHDKDENTYRSLEGSHMIEEQSGDIRLGHLDVESVASARVDGRLVLEWEFVNTIRQRAKFEWRVRWFDADGKQLKGIDNWLPTTLDGEERRPMRTVAIQTAATGWEIATRSQHQSK